MTDPTTSPFWRFSLDLYGQPDIAALCLALQDRHGADVNLVLYALWAGAACGARLDESALTKLETVLRPWRETVIGPLRQVRRHLKTGPPPTPDARTEALRDSVKAAELAAERIAQDLLFRTGALVPTERPIPAETAVTCAAANLRRVLGERVVGLEVVSLDQAALAAVRLAHDSHPAEP